MYRSKEGKVRRKARLKRVEQPDITPGCSKLCKRLRDSLRQASALCTATGVCGTTTSSQVGISDSNALT